MEEPASVGPNRCKTSLAPIYMLKSRVVPGSSLTSFPFAAVSTLGHEFGSGQVRGRPDRPRVSPCSRLSPSEVLQDFLLLFSWSVYRPARFGQYHLRQGERVTETLRFPVSLAGLLFGDHAV